MGLLLGILLELGILLGISPDVLGFTWDISNTIGKTIGNVSQTIGNVIGNTMTDFHRLFGLSWEVLFAQESPRNR